MSILPRYNCSPSPRTGSQARPIWGFAMPSIPATAPCLRTPSSNVCADNRKGVAPWRLGSDWTVQAMQQTRQLLAVCSSFFGRTFSSCIHGEHFDERLSCSGDLGEPCTCTDIVWALHNQLAFFVLKKIP